MLDEAGFDGIVTSDHMIYPRELSSPYPDSPSGKPGWEPDNPWPDAWVLTGAMAAVTTRLRFSNAVYIAPARPILEVARLVATASDISGGRVALAAGVGWMREEYELMGQDFASRGKRLDEMIPALRELWRGGWVSWSGEYYQVPELMVEPHPPAPVPIFCGGESEAALRRAARLCDGWVGYAYSWDDAVGYAQRLNNCVVSTDARTSRSTSCWRFSNRRRSISTGGQKTPESRKSCAGRGLDRAPGSSLTGSPSNGSPRTSSKSAGSSFAPV